MSFLPYWVEIAATGAVLTAHSDTSSWTSNLVSSLRLLRLLRFERYTHAFTTFDDVVARNYDVLAITLFSALLVWVFFGAWLYFTERDNPDEEMASNYNTVRESVQVVCYSLPSHLILLLPHRCQMQCGSRCSTFRGNHLWRNILWRERLRQESWVSLQRKWLNA